MMVNTSPGVPKNGARSCGDSYLRIAKETISTMHKCYAFKHSLDGPETGTTVMEALLPSPTFSDIQLGIAAGGTYNKRNNNK